MAANTTDKFLKATPNFSTTIGSGGVANGTATTIPLDSVSGLATDTAIELVINRLNSSQQITNNYETIRGTVSGTNIVNCARGVEGTAQAWAAGITVEYLATADIQNRLVDGILVDHAQLGYHKSLTDTNGNEWIKQTATASAVNEFTVANAATGNGPTMSATGGDTDIDINITPKGAGDVNLPTGVNIQVNNADPKRGIYVPASAMYPSTTAGCAALAQVESTTNDVNIKVLDFDGAGTSKEYAEFGIPSPSYWDASTVTATFYWYATAGSGTVNWEIQGLALADDDALDTAYGTLQEVTDTLLATGDVHVSAETSAVTIAGTPTAGDWVQFKVARDPANDTNTSDARLMGVRIRFGIAKYDDQ